MTEGNTAGRPTGQPTDDDVLPGERPEPGEVDADPAQEPRAAQGEMSRDPGGTGSGVPDTDHPLGGRNSG